MELRRNKIIRSAAIYFLFFTNTMYAAQHGTSWFYWVTAAVTAAMMGIQGYKVMCCIRK